MTPILAFDIETVPDANGIRLLHGLPANTYLMFQRFRLMSGAADADEYEMEIRRLKGYLKTQEDKVHWQEFLAAWR